MGVLGGSWGVEGLVPLLLAVSLASLSSAGAVSVEFSSFDIRPYDVEWGGGGQRMRIATHTVKFSGPIGLRRRSDGVVLSAQDFNTPMPERESNGEDGGDEFANLTASLFKGLNLRFECMNQNLSTYVDPKELEDDDSFPTNYVMMVPPNKNALARFIAGFSESYPIFDEVIFNNDTLRFAQVVAFYDWREQGNDDGNQDGEDGGQESRSAAKDKGATISRSSHQNLRRHIREALKSQVHPETSSRKLLQEGQQQQQRQKVYDAEGNPWWLDARGMLDQCTLDMSPTPLENTLYEVVDYRTKSLIMHRGPHEEVESPCKSEDVQEVVPKMESLIKRLERGKDQNDLSLGIQTLPLLKLMDGWVGCRRLLGDMVKLKSVNVTLPDTRRCPHAQYTAEYMQDPCCNSQLAFGQCCAPRTLEEQANEIESATIPASCEASVDEKKVLESALKSYAQVNNLQSDPYRGCTALRIERTSQQRMEQYDRFYSTCHTKLWQGQTITGEDSCTDDAECYSQRCVSQNGQKRCAQPFNDFSDAFIRCALEEMDSELLNYMFLTVGIEDASVTSFMTVMKDRFEREDCVGISARDGMCLADVSKAVCDAMNSDGEMMGIWMDDTLMPGMNCKLRWVNWFQQCNGDEQCNCRESFNTTLQTIQPPVSLDFHARWLRYKSKWEWVKVGDDDWEFQATQPGNRTQCLFDSYCNWGGWWDDLSEDECVNPPGKKSMFCGYEQDSFHQDLTSYDRCRLSHSALPTSANNEGPTQAECEQAGGLWVPADWLRWDNRDRCHDCCWWNSTDTTLEQCLPPAICPHEEHTHGIYSNVFGSMCSHQSFCYREDLDQAGCDGLGGYRYWAYGNELCITGMNSPDGAGDGFSTEQQCVDNGGTWFVARYFEKGVRQSESACAKGVCTSSPQNPLLAENNGADCSGGFCNMFCRRLCDAGWDRANSVCVANDRKTSESCNETFMEWNPWLQLCHNTKDDYGTLEQCQELHHANTYSCRDLDWESCSDPSLYSGPYGLIGCYPHEYAQCRTSQECQGSGECDDWNYRPTVSNITCRVPFTASEWGHPNTDCNSLTLNGQPLSALSESIVARSAWNDGCIIQGLTEDQCTSLSGEVRYARFRNRQECEQEKGCFNDLRGFLTGVNVEDCSRPGYCDQSVYTTKPRHSWRQGKWAHAEYLPDGTSWIRREMLNKNQWKRAIPEDALQAVLQDAKFSIQAVEYAKELKCQMMPLRVILDVVACTCGEADQAHCTDVLDKVGVAVLSSQCVFNRIDGTALGVDGGDPLNVETCIATAGGSACVDTSSLPAGCVEMNFGVVLTEWWRGNIENFLLRRKSRTGQHNSRLRGLSTRETVVAECSDYEVIEKNAVVIGQVVGNGLEIGGLAAFNAGTQMPVCLPMDPNIPVCHGKYPVADFALGLADRTPGEPLNVAENVTFDGQSMCAHVILQGAPTMLLYPIVRTVDSMPYEAYSGMVVRGHLTFGAYNNLAVFGILRQTAFRQAMLECVPSADYQEDIIITEICEEGDAASGNCVATDLLSIGHKNHAHHLRTTGNPAGLHVDFRIAVSQSSANSVEGQLEHANFPTCFEQEFKEATGESGALSITVQVDEVVQDTVTPSGGSWPHALAESANCQCSLSWPELMPFIEAETAVTGGLGLLMEQTPDFQVWMCFESPGHSECGCSQQGDPMCYVFHETEEKFYAWGRNSKLQLCPP